MQLLQFKLPLALLAGGSIIIILIGILGWVVLPNVIDNKITDETQLKKGSDTFEKWETAKHMDIVIYFYVYNITNPQEFEYPNDPKPIVKEVGPYAYREARHKRNVYFHDNGEVSYDEEVKYFFVEELSITEDGKQLEEEDLINIYDIAYASILYGMTRGDYPPILGPIMAVYLGEALKHKVIRENVEVGEFIFRGIDTQKYFPLPPNSPIIPEEFRGGTFALLKNKNDSMESYTIKTGEDNHKTFGFVQRWNKSENYLNFWGKDSEGNAVRNTCNRIRGTDGTLFPPFLEKDRIIEAFNVDICRSLKFQYRSENEIRGLDTYRFTFADEEYDTAWENSDKKCFCPQVKNENDEDEIREVCPNRGVFQLRSCRSESPIVLTLPRFNKLWSGYLNLVDGVEEADPDFHQTILNIEVKTGALVEASKSIQINLKLEELNLPPFEGKLERIIPILWFREHALMKQGDADDIKSQLNLIKIVDIVKWVVMGIGIIILVLGAFVFWRYKKQLKVQTV